MLRTPYFIEATVELKPNGDVSVALSPDASHRFETFTCERVNRRIAIVLDGTIDSAPILKSAVTGGHITVLGGAMGDLPARREADERLARALRGH